MLDGLDAVRWGELEHAYGAADDVPDLLRSLASPDKEERKNALWSLYGNTSRERETAGAGGTGTAWTRNNLPSR